MKLKYIIITIIILCIFSILGNNTNNNKTEKNSSNNTLKINIISVQDGITLKSYKESNTSYIKKIETILKNNTGTEINMIRIIIDCYDKDNNNLGKSKEYEMNINTKDNYKIETWIPSETTKANVYIEYLK